MGDAYLTKSRLTTYMWCPAEYKKQYIDGIKEETEALIRGREVHRFIEHAYTDDWVTINNDGTGIPQVQGHPDRWDDQFRSQYRDYVDTFIKREQRRMTELCLDPDMDWQEHFLPQHVEYEVRGELFGHTCKGYIDAVRPTPDSPVIVDYKTGTAPGERAPRTVKRRRLVEIGFYALLYEQQEHVDVDSGVFEYLGGTGAYRRHKLTSKERDRVKAAVRRIGERIDNEDFDCECGDH